ncbi:MAG: PIN domain nuclease [Syntrophus sp. (in: bacteria)]|nr:PIN domain nuclease [Syntrophus sp. (in: bacteria)]
MNCLLDTHTFLWSIFDPAQISAKARGIIRNPDNIIHVSVVTFWEISLKYAIGKLELTQLLPDEFPGVARQMNLSIMNLSEQESATFYKLPQMEHKDPFDRLVIWQAIHHRMSLISKDSKLKGYRRAGLKLIW